jgi:cob(I)alamin adenosyltransferase
MTWRQLHKQIEALEESLENMPAFGHFESTKHFARIELANTVARAKEILEALAHDENPSFTHGAKK